jgi:hypothetical protein
MRISVRTGARNSFSDHSIFGNCFLNKINDLIGWKPNSSGIWQPENTKKVTTYGLNLILLSIKNRESRNYLE